MLTGCILQTFGQVRSFAQNEPTMAEQVEHIFGQLDFTEVSSDVLYDIGFDYFNWHLMHGRYLSDSIVVTASQWGYLCFQASSSGLNDYDPVPEAAPYFAWANKLPSDPDTVALGVLHLDFHFIKEDAVPCALMDSTCMNPQLNYHLQPSCGNM